MSKYKEFLQYYKKVHKNLKYIRHFKQHMLH